MKKLVLVLAVLCATCAQQEAVNPEVAAWEQRAQNVTIIRDDWGIAHVYGKSDADTVFGVIYAQAEDDFKRVELNYMNSMGRLAEAEGEKEIYRDLRMKLFIDPEDMKASYEQSPDWLKALMNAWADGLNYYLHTHPEVTPRVITRFEPWMALTFTEGSIGGDIERVNLRELEAFYGSRSETRTTSVDDGRPAEPTGSNGIAVAPANTATGHAMLLINPHTSHYFRAELQAVSEEGLNAYGAVTWGQFFIYQGFNDRAGWMHTSSGADNIDEYLETVVQRDTGYVYRYGTEERPMTVDRITVPYRTASGMSQKEFTVYRTHHGPVVREVDGKWVTVRLMQEPIKALTQSYNRTKARNLNAYLQVMELHTNSSNNTVYADADGNIAYLHSNFVPKRDPRFDWTRPVDGSDPATEWGEPHSVAASPNAMNPPNGWVQNTNNWPYSAAGPHSPKKLDFPAYFQTSGENPRGIHAIQLLEKKKDFTLDSFLAAAFDTHLPSFDSLIPALVRAWDQTPASNPLKAKLAEQIKLLRAWDRRAGVDSVETSLASFWGDEMFERVGDAARQAGMSVYDYIPAKTTGLQRLEALAAASDRLEADFGTWRTPWGEINRFQRISSDIVQQFDDAQTSVPVGFASSRWGSLASFGGRRFNGTKRLYTTGGNSFVAVVEFGDRVRARAITAGGESGDPASPHFRDQAARFAAGDLREVYFYRDQLEGHTEREYRPGN